MRAARLSGLEEIDAPVSFRGATRDSTEFAAAYEDMKVMLAARSGAIVAKRTVRPKAQVCSGPIKYVGHDEVRADLENLKAALNGAKAEEAFVTAISPSNLELYYENRYYASDEEYLAALADAMHDEYKAIVDAGFLLQIDDPRMATHYNRARDASIEDCRKFIALRVEAVNHALRGIPEDRVRFHTCYSVNIAPRVHDFELKHFADLMLKVNARRLPDRGRQPAPRARMAGLAGREAARRQDPDSRRGVALHPPGRASGTGGAAHRALRRRGRARAGDRRHRLRLRHLGRRRRGASRRRLGEARALVEGAKIASQRLWGGEESFLPLVPAKAGTQEPQRNNLHSRLRGNERMIKPACVAIFNSAATAATTSTSNIMPGPRKLDDVEQRVRRQGLALEHLGAARAHLVSIADVGDVARRLDNVGDGRAVLREQLADLLPCKPALREEIVLVADGAVVRSSDPMPAR